MKEATSTQRTTRADSSEPDDEERDDLDCPPTVLEWSMRVGSTLLLLAIFAYLVYGASHAHVGPNFGFDVKRAEIEERENGWAVPVDIINRGTVAIGDVYYEARLVGDGPEDFLVKQGAIKIFGAKETVRVELWFEEDPGERELEFRVESYTL